MMLSRKGQYRVQPLGRGKTVEDRRSPWGRAAGVPYRGTASPVWDSQSTSRLGPVDVIGRL